MPILVLVDTSFSMNQNVPQIGAPYQEPPISRISLAQSCLKSLFEFLKIHNRFEMTGLILFSRITQLLAKFTRDYDYLMSLIPAIQTFDKTNLVQALAKADEMIGANYNSDLIYDVLVITDGMALTQHPAATLGRLFGEEESSLDVNNANNNNNFSPKFRYKIHIFCLTTVDNLMFQRSLPFYREILNRNFGNKPSAVVIEPNVAYEAGQICVPTTVTAAESYRVVAENLFLKLCREHLKAYSGKLICGHLSGPVTLYPGFPLEKIHPAVDFSPGTLDTIRICGFLNTDEMSDPPILSRHYVMPLAEKNLDQLKALISFINVKLDLPDEEILAMVGEESRQPSFAVLLHGSFKIANMIALCEIGSSRQWYGILQPVSTAGDKKRSNLMLYAFEPGLNSVSWIPNLRRLTMAATVGGTPNDTLNSSRPPIKKAQSHFVWLQQLSIKNDVQKILRFIRKLPDKYDQLMAEINRIQRAAIAFQFFEMIDTLIQTFENDAKMLPNHNNPEVINQIDQILKQLKQQQPITVNPK